ncbi:LysR family transcriptional regulator [Ciceribacter ferrooxidans]|uniref:LysR family transcriptional regulator n=1 Tax=Ciceribacter ferrooxidans TaxID=2509717 RepID=A0A4Q2SAG6_9HYPH|nr:LysR substrate-binding domain-containing protein [Ciceribacter ferrooxidans]RYB98034.1 LysR family transcriptional regulator [Ciceribacter ferrooxidans]
MELRQLHYFVTAAKVEHFTVAARQLNIVQSALSSAIKALEEELDAKLFVRSTRQVRLTPAGRTLLEKAQIVLDAAQEARDSVKAVQDARYGKIGIGTVQGLPPFLDLPALLADFHRRYPEVEVRLCQGGLAHLIDKLRNGLIDLAFLPVVDTPPDIVTRMIACEDLVTVCALGHPLAGRTSIDLAEIAGHAFVDFEPDRGTRRLIDDAFSARRLERRTAFEVSDLDSLMELVGHGLGIALVPETVAAAWQGEIHVAEIADAEICWELVVASPAKSADGAGGGAPGRFLELLPEVE